MCPIRWLATDDTKGDTWSAGELGGVPGRLAVAGWSAGQSHLSIPAVDVIVTAEPIRAEVASELARLLQVGAPAPA